MRKAFGFYVLAWVCALSCAFASPGLAAEIALVPVSANQPHAIVGNEITVPAGSNVIFEIHVSGWDPNLTGMPLLRAYQMALDDATYSSGTQGALTPATVPCVSDTTCVGAFGGACSLTGNPCSSDVDCEFPEFGEVCRGPTCSFFVDGVPFCTPAFIANKRVDFIFNGLPLLDVVDLSSTAIRFGATILDVEPIRDSGVVTYAGTLILELPANAAGTFTVGFLQSPDTFLLVGLDTMFSPTLLSPARIVIGDVCGSDFDCDDNSLCTDDTCLGGTCAFTPNFEDTISCCDPGTGSLCGKTRGIPGDASLDGVVDLSDFLLLQNCFGLDPVPAECRPADVDCHCDVGLGDVAGFASVLTGP